MRLKAPSTWYNTDQKPPLYLSALVPFYRTGHFLHQTFGKAYKASKPVICVGNLVAGGSGKTPVVDYIARFLKDSFPAHKHCILSRGYGGDKKGPAFVDRIHDSPDNVGDEPYMLALKHSVAIAANRRQGAELIEKHGYDTIIMDDGLQNPSLHKDVSFIVIDGQTGFGNGQVLPAGPLREPLQSGFKKADAFIVIGEDKTDLKAELPQGIPVFQATIMPQFTPDPHRKYVAFCGLGRPEKFQQTLTQLGTKTVMFKAYPDHFNYTDEDLSYLADTAKELDAMLLTTEKDAVKLPAGFIEEHEVDILPIAIKWEQEQELKNFLLARIKI